MRVVGVLVVAVLALLGVAGTAAAEVRRPCERGEFCVWGKERYRGEARRISLENANPGECVSLGVDVRSFVNRMSRPVTVYQGRECETEAEFDTYPGGGTYVPEAPFVVRGVQIWEN